MRTQDPIVIVGSKRTPIGNLLGELQTATASQLASTAIKASIEHAKIDPSHINSVIMGCVLPAGQGQAPARQATLGADIPTSAECTTINKMCGSGMKAVMLAHDSILAGSHEIAIAGGMESMSNAPYLLLNARRGHRLGHQKVYDHMFLDGLEDAYDKAQLMGVFAEHCVEKFGFTRKAQDDFSLLSLERAQKAIADGTFAREISPFTVHSAKGASTIIEQDEGPRKAKPDKIPTLKPAFKKDGTVTAANSSSISDGAAALVLMRRSKAEKLGLTPIATIVEHSVHSQQPNWFTTAPISAIKKLCAKTQWQLNQVDLFEINEAFACVTMAAMHELDLPQDKVNIHGGACALGHPIGASGARIIVTLINALQKHDLKRGIAALCIGGGEATAVAIELN